MFVTVISEDSDMVTAWSSTYKSQFSVFKNVHLPDGELNVGHDFTVLDTKEEQVFLFLENHGVESPFGSLYISDSDARYFTLSLPYVIKGQNIDFARVDSLDGTYIVNVYEPHGEPFQHR